LTEFTSAMPGDETEKRPPEESALSHEQALPAAYLFPGLCSQSGKHSVLPAEISGRKSEFIANPDDAFFQRAYDGGEGRSHDGEPRSAGQGTPGK
jgi:hypothetical protein